MTGTTHAVGLSGGKDSTAMALRLAELMPEIDFQYLCTPTGNELPSMTAHWSRLEELLGKPLIRLRARTDLKGLIEHYRALPNWRQRWCTRELKIEPYRSWLLGQAERGPVISYIGLRADEEEREGVDYTPAPDLFGRSIDCRFVLREWGWGIAEVYSYLDERGVVIPFRTDCAWCYGQRLSEWRDLWANHPGIYAEGEAIEEATGFTFRSPGRDTWPASLSELRLEFERGRPLREARDERGKVCRACSL